MTRIATIELQHPQLGTTSRVFLARELLSRLTVEELEKQLGEHFSDDEDAARMVRIEAILRSGAPVCVSVHPGETSPPEYHAFVVDPAEPDTPLFATVLAPPSVVAELVAETPHVVMETATFQAMDSDVSLSGLRAAIERWAKRVFPALELPRFEVRPWPVEEVHSFLPPATDQSKGNVVPAGAPSELQRTDFPTPEELRSA